MASQYCAILRSHQNTVKMRKAFLVFNRTEHKFFCYSNREKVYEKYAPLQNQSYRSFCQELAKRQLLEFKMPSRFPGLEMEMELRILDIK